MSPETLTDDVVAARCGECDELLNSEGECLNIECDVAISAATRAAGRETAKATASAADTRPAEPRAWTSFGRVD